MGTLKLGTLSIATIAIAGILLTLTTIAALTASQTLPLSGTITSINVGVYSDSGCTQNCTSLNVGTVSPGGTATQTVYIKNTGTAPETLSMTVTNWNPTTATSYLTLSWNQAGTVLPAGQSVQATLTLTVASNAGALTSFSCSVTITGTQ